MPTPANVNPWLAVPIQPPYVLRCDSDAISAYNAKARHDYNKIQLGVMPEPFIGSATAPVVLLNLNPGFDAHDNAAHERPDFEALLRNNYSQGRASFPFYYLDPAVETPGRCWWEKKLRWLIEEFGREELARSILCVEYFPYHSRRFDHSGLVLPSQEYGFGLVRSAIARGSVVVTMRAERRWKEKVHELGGYRRAFRLKNPQNVVVSPRNCSGSGFDELVRAVRAGLTGAPMREESH
jgi:hypothetical protein